MLNNFFLNQFSVPLGKDTGIIDILLVGDIDEYHLNDLSRKIESRKPIPSGIDGLSDFSSLPVKCTAYFTGVKKSNQKKCLCDLCLPCSSGRWYWGELELSLHRGIADETNRLEFSDKIRNNIYGTGYIGQDTREKNQ